jgi:hypothetical protein
MISYFCISDATTELFDKLFGTESTDKLIEIKKTRL